MNKNKKSSFFQKTLRLKLEPNTNVEEQIGGLYMFVENTSSFIDVCALYKYMYLHKILLIYIHKLVRYFPMYYILIIYVSSSTATHYM